MKSSGAFFQIELNSEIYHKPCISSSLNFSKDRMKRTISRSLKILCFFITNRVISYLLRNWYSHLKVLWFGGQNGFKFTPKLVLFTITHLIEEALNLQP